MPMKRTLKIAALALVIVLGSSLRNTVSAQYADQYNDENRDVSYQTFYDELSPHGRWIDYPGQGYVWVPEVSEDFRPYSTNGHWVWSDNYEWMWVSDYDWGWAPFHYGRWDQDADYGWYWVPGYEWSPAWVAWRDGGDYYGWAPIRPGINISINFNIGGYSPPNDFWCFAPRRYITSPRIYDYCVDRRQNITIINYTTVIVNNYRYGNNYGFGSGPRRYDAERYCGRINPVRFRESYTPGRSSFRNNEVSIYRPAVRQDNNRNFSPRSFERYDRNTDNGFGRNNKSREGNNSDNKLPVRQNRNDNGGFERKDGDQRQPQNNSGYNNNNDHRRFERTDINNNQPNRDGDRIVTTSPERIDRNPNPGNNNSSNDNRRFERRDNNNGNMNIPVRQPEEKKNDNNWSQRPTKQSVEKREEPRQQLFERRQETRQQPQQPVERRQEPRQQPMERRQEPKQQTTQQPMERRQEPRQENRQEQPRQFERRDEGNRQQNNSGNTDNRSSRKRF